MSYNCFIPMPFEKSAKITLIDDTQYDLMNYSYVEFEKLESWYEDLGYFHASWKRDKFQLGADTNKHFFHIDGKGHLIGRTCSICTDQQMFGHFYYVMEGNIDGSRYMGRQILLRIPDIDEHDGSIFKDNMPCDLVHRQVIFCNVHHPDHLGRPELGC